MDRRVPPHFLGLSGLFVNIFVVPLVHSLTEPRAGYAYHFGGDKGHNSLTASRSE